VSGRRHGAAMLACLGLGAADVLVLNLAVLPHLDGGVAVPLPPLAVEPAARPLSGEVQLGAISVVHSAPVVEQPAQPAPHLVIEFRKSSHRVERRARKLLAAEVPVIAAASSVVVVGHSDPSGPADLNERLSAERASAVARFLREQGLDSQRLRVEFRGAREPCADCEQRRVEIYLGGEP
jgi:outer membrane protein OmpA-like peptidoglycan-associated protein